MIENPDDVDDIVEMFIRESHRSQTAQEASGDSTSAVITEGDTDNLVF